MWHDDNWVPYAEHDVSSATANNWRRHRPQLSMQGASMGSQLMGNHPVINSRNLPYPNRPIGPYARPMPQSHSLMHNGHSQALVAASRDLNWRNSNDEWGPLPFRVRNPAAWHTGPTPLSAAISDLSKPLVEITTPHAGGELRARPIQIKRAASESSDDLLSSIDGVGRIRKQPALYSDFSEPAKPKTVKLSYEANAIRISMSWTFPDLPPMQKYKQKIEVRDDLTIIEEDTLAPHITSFRFKTTPGCYYVVNLKILDTHGGVVASGTKDCKAMFSLSEIDKLMVRALDFTGSAMQSFSFLYRCKPKIYWDDIYFRTHGIIERYMKDNNGQAASPINGSISGLFFSARTLADNSLPPSSPFGDIRMIIPAITLLDPTRVSLFFCDFYCNRITHYVTVVVCEKGSQTEEFCKEKLKPLKIDDNRFLRITSTNNPNMPYAFYVNKSVWVEIYYTENIPMHWGRFDHIMATGAGTSKIGGLPHNKSCLTCNLYPIGPQPGVDMEPVEDLVATYEGEAKLETAALFLQNSTRYTALGCIQAELLTPSFKISSEISKETYLEVAEVIVYCVNHVVFDQSYDALEKFNKTNSPSKVSSSSFAENKNSILDEVELAELICLDSSHSPPVKDYVSISLEPLESTSSGISTDAIINPDNIHVNDNVKMDVDAENISSCDDLLDLNEAPSINLQSMESLDLMRLLNKINKSVSNVPMVFNLISKLKALVKEMDQGFTTLNSDIDTKLNDMPSTVFLLRDASEVPFVVEDGKKDESESS